VRWARHGIAILCAFFEFVHVSLHCGVPEFVTVSVERTKCDAEACNTKNARNATNPSRHMGLCF